MGAKKLWFMRGKTVGSCYSKLWEATVNCGKLLQQAEFAGFGNGKHTFAYAQFAVDVFDVVEHGVEADDEGLGNFFVF